MKILCSSALLITVLVLAGCANHLLNDNGVRRLTGADSVPVFLSIKDSVRVERVKGFMSGSSDVETGQVWKHAFIGNADAKASIEIISTQMRQSLASAGFAMRFTYTAEARFHYKDQVYILKGKGTRAATLKVESPMRQAVELAVLDIANQVKALMSPLPASQP